MICRSGLNTCVGHGLFPRTLPGVHLAFDVQALCHLTEPAKSSHTVSYMLRTGPRMGFPPNAQVESMTNAELAAVTLEV